MGMLFNIWTFCLLLLEKYHKFTYNLFFPGSANLFPQFKRFAQNISTNI